MTSNDRYDPVAHAEEIVAFYRSRPKLWEVAVTEARQAREEGRSAFGTLTRSELAVDREIPGPAGPMRVRMFVPEGVTGVYLHIHGGGWMLGGAHHLDSRNEEMARRCRLAVVSVDYRLTPENPYPAGPDDCEAAARWLTEYAPSEFGTNRLFIGGESAGAHLSLVTLLRLRDRHDATPFAAANLVYGMYDLRGLPSVRQWGDIPMVISTPIIDFFVDMFARRHDLLDPDLSPLYARLHRLPPAMFTVGSRDPLLDDSTFMAARWRSAGHECELNVVADAFHGFDYFDTPLGASARQRMYDFLDRH